MLHNFSENAALKTVLSHRSVEMQQ